MPPEQVAAAALSLYDAPSADDTHRRQVEAWVAEAVRKRPEAVVLAAKLGAVWIRQGRFDEAEGLLRRLLVSDPDNTEALNTLAWLLALRDQGKPQEAIELIDRAIEIVGENPSLLDTRAVARIKLGQVDQAMEELLAIRKQAPHKSSFALHLAWAYQAKANRSRHAWNSGGREARLETQVTRSSRTCRLPATPERVVSRLSSRGSS